jgi:hypothetical protein
MIVIRVMKNNTFAIIAIAAVAALLIATTAVSSDKSSLCDKEEFPPDCSSVLYKREC